MSVRKRSEVQEVLWEEVRCIRIAKVYDVSMDWLVGLSERMNDNTVFKMEPVWNRGAEGRITSRRKYV